MIRKRQEWPAGSQQQPAPAIELIDITKRFPGVLANDRVKPDRAARRGALSARRERGRQVHPDQHPVRDVASRLREASGWTAPRLSIRSPERCSPAGHRHGLPAFDPDPGAHRAGEPDARRPVAEAGPRRGAQTAGRDGGDARHRRGPGGADGRSGPGPPAAGRDHQAPSGADPGCLSSTSPHPCSHRRAWRNSRRSCGASRIRATAVVFITHKLHEALAVGDRVSILRRGRLGRCSSEQLSRPPPRRICGPTIIRLMFEEETAEVAGVPELTTDLAAVEEEHSEPGVLAPEADVFLELNVRLGPRGGGRARHRGRLSLRAAAVARSLGVAGVDGNGQRALAEAIGGQRRGHLGDGRAVRRPREPSERLRQAEARPALRDRRPARARASSGTLGVSLNLFLKRIGAAAVLAMGPDPTGGALNARGERPGQGVRHPHPRAGSHAPGRSRAGTSQKLLLARELSFEPKVVVFHKPTYGLDLKTHRTMSRTVIRDLVGKGAAVARHLHRPRRADRALRSRSRCCPAGAWPGIVDNGLHAVDQVVGP